MNNCPNPVKIIFALLIILQIDNPCRSYGADISMQVVEGENKTTYKLVITENGREKTFWENQVDKIGGVKPLEWRSLIAWDSSDRQILALLNINDFEALIVRYNAHTNQSQEFRMSGIEMFRNKRNGGSIKVIAPDSITSKSADGEEMNFIIVDDKLVKKDGASTKTIEKQSIQINATVNETKGETSSVRTEKHDLQHDQRVDVKSDSSEFSFGNEDKSKFSDSLFKAIGIALIVAAVLTLAIWQFKK